MRISGITTKLRNRLTILVVFLILATIVSAQTSFVLDLESNNLNFSNANRTVVTNTGSSSTGLPGTATGSVHRYDNLFTDGVINLSANITLLEVSNVDINIFDDDSTFPGRFQPKIGSTSSTGGRVVYKVDYFDANTNLPVYVFNYYLTLIDIDGNSSVPVEFVEFGNYSSYTMNNPTNLTITTDNVSGRTKASSGVLAVTGIAFEDKSALIANYNNASSTITFALGMMTSYTQNGGRQYSSQLGVPISNFSNPVITLNPYPLASDDNGVNIVSSVGGVSVSDVLTNDIYLGTAVNRADFTISVESPSTEAGVVLDTITGEVTVTPGTPAGIYTIIYRITNNSDNSKFDVAKITVEVVSNISTLSLLKTRVGNIPVFANDTLSYDLEIQNMGNVPLTNITLTDDYAEVGNSNVGTLNPGEHVNIQAKHILTQEDINAGTYLNTAIVQGLDPIGTVVKDTSGTAVDNNLPTITPIPQIPSIKLIKTISGVLPIEVGLDSISYTLEIENTGNMILTDIVLTDDSAVIKNPNIASLAPGEHASVEATHILTQSDVNAGTYSNTAYVSAKDQNNTIVKDTSRIVTALEQISKVALTKNLTGPVPTQVGQEIAYNLEVQNMGNMVLYDLIVTDNNGFFYIHNPLFPLDTIVNTIESEYKIDSVKPNESIFFNVFHTLTSADITAGKVINTAMVKGTNMFNVEVVDSSGYAFDNNIPTEVLIPWLPTLTLVKTVTSPVPTKAGDVIDYQFVLKHTGNVAVSNINVSDAYATLAVGAIPTMNPGDSTTFTASQVMTQADIDAGMYSNSATVTGKDPKNGDVIEISGTSETNDDPTITIIPQSPVVRIVKTLTSSIPTAAGDSLNYSLVVRNTGTVTLTNLAITDTNAVVNGSPIATLAPNESTTITATHIATQADIDAGMYSNTAIVTGKDPNNNDVTDISGVTETNDDPTVTIIPQSPSVTLVKLVTGELPVNAGEILNYTLGVKNTGNVTLSNLVITDAKAVVSGSPIATLAPGDSVTITASQVMTQADIDAGTYTNTATVIGKDPKNNDVSDISGTLVVNNDPTITTLPQSPSVALVKLATGTLPSITGETLNYTLGVKNTGNVTLTNLVVTDAKAVVSGSPIAILAPGDSITITASQVMTQADIDAGTYTNTATVTGKDPKNNDVTDVSGTSVSNDDPTVTVLGATPPLATDDSATTTQNTSITITILNNDNFGTTTPSSGSITTTDPLHGTVEVLDNGTPNDPTDDQVIYTPETYYKGADSFTYTICNSTGQCSTATVTVTINPLSDLIKATKSSSIPVMNFDGTFSWKYMIVLENMKNELIDSIHIEDNLDQVFNVSPQPEYEVVSLYATGNLQTNGLYNGSNISNVLIDRSYLNGLAKDTIFIELKVNTNSFVGKVYNQAIFEGKTLTGIIRGVLSDDTSLPGETDPTVTDVPEITLTIPDAFSPNSDGFNDFFVIIHANFVKLKFEVFNRWGNSVYKNDDYQNDWDGKGTGNFLGQDLPSGTYYFIIETVNQNDGTVQKFSNYLTLRRK